uniref:CULLIN_2 domain-containing protein n=1 Tax=Panagrellus redivivus TaxID=6233 RepID=A0A7E4ZTS4_PANRE
MLLRPRVEVSADDPEMEMQMNAISQAIIEVQNKRQASTDFVTLYHFIYQMCLNDLGPDLYANTGDLIVTHLQEKVCAEVIELPQTEFLAGILNQYHDHLIVSQWISHLFTFVDSTLVRLEMDPEEHLLTTFQLSYDLFRQHVLGNDHIKEHLTSFMLATVNADREGDTIDWLTFKKVCQMLITCGIESRGFYEEVFETPFLEQTAKFFRDQSESFIKDNTASDYVKKVNESLNEEEERALRFLDDATRAKLSNVLHEQLIAPHMETVVNMDTGVEFMVRNNHLDQLRDLYKLLAFLPEGKDVFTTALKKFIRDAGQEFTNPETDFEPIKYIESIVALRNQFKLILVEACNSDLGVQKTLQYDFKHIINLHERVAEYLCQYFDQAIKANPKEAADINAKTIQGGIDVFCFINDKDVFEKYYRQYLSKRLLAGKETLNEDDVEKTVVNLFKLECGSSYVDKFEAMFRDIAKSAILMGNFPKWVTAEEERELREAEGRLVIESMITAVEKQEEEEKLKAVENEAAKEGEKNGAPVDSKIEDTPDSKTDDKPDPNTGDTTEPKEDGDIAEKAVAISEANPKEKDIDIYVKVVNTTHWPLTDTRDERAKITLPPDAERAMMLYMKYYVASHESRHVDLWHNFGTADVIAFFCPPADDEIGFTVASKLLVVTTHMMCILDRFNYRDEIKYEELLLDTKLPEQMLKRALFSMTSKKSQRILARKAAGRVLGIGDSFSINNEFVNTCKNYRVRVANMLPKGATEKLHDDKKKDADPAKQDAAHWAKVDRPYEVDAAAVRIMKARKTMSHQELIAEITQVLANRFVPTPVMIKRRLEDLLYREFLARDEADMNLYHYVA